MKLITSNLILFFVGVVVLRTMAWQPPIGNPALCSSPPAEFLSRRAALDEIRSMALVTPLLFVSTPTPAFAGQDSNTEKEANRITAEQKRREKEERAKEKEARRIAEETKKRLAVGRIGRIGAL